MEKKRQSRKGYRRRVTKCLESFRGIYRGFTSIDAGLARFSKSFVSVYW